MKTLPCPLRLLQCVCLMIVSVYLQRGCQQRMAESVLCRFILAATRLLLLLLLGLGTLHSTGFSWKTHRKNMTIDAH